MPYADTNGIQLYYDVHGTEGDTPIVLLYGLGQQCTEWPREFLDQLGRDRHVLTIDLRDAGLSTKLGPCLEPDLPYEWDAALEYARSNPTPYTLQDMADDVIGAMSALGVSAYHVAGFSLGGMVAQLVAARDKDRVASLTSLASSGGQAEFSPPEEGKTGMKAYLQSFPTKEEAIEAVTRSNLMFLEEGSSITADDIRPGLRTRYDRSYCPAGSLRQFWAVVTSGDRAEALSQISCPTLIVLGEQDISIPVKYGERLHHLVRGSRLEILENMGHSIEGDPMHIILELIREQFDQR